MTLTPVVEDKVKVYVKFIDCLLEDALTFYRTLDLHMSDKAKYVRTKLAEAFDVEHRLCYNVIVGFSHKGENVEDGTSLQECLEVPNKD